MKKYLSFLIELHAHKIPFFERDILDHLRGTYEVLGQWQVPNELAVAGLFHAIYLTEFFNTNEPNSTNRELIAAEIGSKAEQIAYSYCVMNRLEFIGQESTSLAFTDTYLDDQVNISKLQDQQLVELIWANSIEQIQGETAPFKNRPELVILFEKSKNRVSSAALKSYRSLL